MKGGKLAFAILFIAIASALTLAIGCTQAAAPAPAAKTEPAAASKAADKAAAPAPQLPKELIYSTSEAGSSSHTVAVGVADLIMKYSPMKVTVRAIGGPTSWLPLFQNGQADIGGMNFDDLYEAYHGVGGYEKATGGKGYDIRYLASTMLHTVAVMVRNDSPYRKISDLKGAKVPTGFGGNVTVGKSLKGLLANGGLSEKDIVGVPITSAYGADAISFFQEGKIAVHGPSLGSSYVTQMDATVGIRFLPYDNSPEAVARGREWYISEPFKVKKGEFPGIFEDMYVRAHLYGQVASPKLSDDAAYAATKMIWDNFKELLPIHPDVKYIDPDRIVSKNATVPYHPGAVRFYKEIGKWNNELEAIQQDLLAKKK